MLRVENLRKVYQEGTKRAFEAVADLSFTIEERELVVLAVNDAEVAELAGARNIQTTESSVNQRLGLRRL